MALDAINARFAALSHLLAPAAEKIATLPPGDREKFWLSRAEKQLETEPDDQIAEVFSRLERSLSSLSTDEQSNNAAL
jgi:hypothetical protein